MKEGEAKIFFNKIFSISTYWILLKVHFELFAHIQSSHLTFGRTKADGLISILQVKKKSWIRHSLILTSHLLSVLSLDYLLQNGKVWVCLMNMIPDTQRHSMNSSGIAKWANTSRSSLERKNWANKLLVRIFFKVHWFIITVKLYAN